MTDGRDPDEDRRVAEVHQRMAAAAETMADLSDEVAGVFDRRADISGDDDGRRRAVATWEREVGAVERRNAAKLRAGDVHDLEHLPERPEQAGGPTGD